MNPTAPNGRYFVVRVRLWRCSNPALVEDERQRLVNELMDARRAVKAAKTSGDPGEMKKCPRGCTGTQSGPSRARAGLVG